MARIRYITQLEGNIVVGKQVELRWHVILLSIDFLPGSWPLFANFAGSRW